MILEVVYWIPLNKNIASVDWIIGLKYSCPSYIDIHPYHCPTFVVCRT